ncbi:MAG: protein kinase [Alphaproteobacteria bacterium]|nr:protein kinase [Alphaproteobacteria bacterium]
MAELLAHPDGRDELAFGTTIGTGGMGVVRTAEQVRLHRTVAVKSLRTDIDDPEATRKLLAEAWMTGALEHPNIVPVYDIAVDDAHRPHIVMKRITGIEWESVMDDGPAIAERFGTHDLLAWNLGILMAVCNALHYAHDRGIVHRDVKPQNVMVGEFGEVYLVDWGIAVPLKDDGRIPAVGGGRIAGTPRYMAPEMVRAEPVTVATDIYLLGGVLHRILTGVPPHRGWSIREILDGIASSCPPSGPRSPKSSPSWCVTRWPSTRAHAFRAPSRCACASRRSSSTAGPPTSPSRPTRASRRCAPSSPASATASGSTGTSAHAGSASRRPSACGPATNPR